MTNADLQKLKCKYARKCPGCPKIQFVYAKQIHDKQKALDLLFAPLAVKAGIKIPPVIRSPLQSGYRTTSKLALHQDNFGRRSVGIYERQSKDVVDIPDCPVHDHAINDIVAKMFRSATPAPFEYYHHGKKTFQENRAKFVTVRLGTVLTGSALKTSTPGIIISHTGIDEAALRVWASRAAPKGASVWGCRLTPADKDLVLNDTLTHLSGPETIPFAAGSLQLELRPASFFQANASLSRDFLAYICGGHQQAAGGTLLDLYGGFGAYSLSLATVFKDILLVDGNSDATRSAVAAAAGMGVKHLQAKAQYCEAFLKDLPATKRRAVTDIIVNPPRAGLSETVRRAISRSQFSALERATYVSCNPETLKRDLNVMTKSGARIAAIQPFDMFPQTGHVETVVRLKF
jgi:23S rRNA (uracil1939-C5)-methyltransferase